MWLKSKQASFYYCYHDWWRHPLPCMGVHWQLSVLIVLLLAPCVCKLWSMVLFTLLVHGASLLLIYMAFWFVQKKTWPIYPWLLMCNIDVQVIDWIVNLSIWIKWTTQTTLHKTMKSRRKITKSMWKSFI